MLDTITKAAVELPEIDSYGRYSSGNYGAHTLCVQVAGRTLYFSYKTLVAFRGTDGKLHVRGNVWGPTTGKHLNWIDGGNVRARLAAEAFEAAWAAEIGG